MDIRKPIVPTQAKQLKKKKKRNKRKKLMWTTKIGKWFMAAIEHKLGYKITKAIRLIKE